MSQAAVSGLWNAAYAVGWAAGPFVGGALYEALKAHTLCVGGASSSDYDSTASCEAFNSTAAGACSCEWVAQNGFDGFGTLVAVVCGGFGALLFAAAAANVRARCVNTRHTCNRLALQSPRVTVAR